MTNSIFVLGNLGVLIMGIDVTLIIIRQEVPICVWPAFGRTLERGKLYEEILDNSTRIGDILDTTIDGDSAIRLMKYETFCNLVQGAFSHHFSRFPLEKINPTDKIYFNFG